MGAVALRTSDNGSAKSGDKFVRAGAPALDPGTRGKTVVRFPCGGDTTADGCARSVAATISLPCRQSYQKYFRCQVGYCFFAFWMVSFFWVCKILGGMFVSKRFLSLSVFLVVLLYATVAFAIERIPSEPRGSTKSAVVVRIVDGDTIRAKCDGREIAVRMIGIDTPESRANDRAEKQSRSESKPVKEIVRLGKRATRRLELLLRPGDKIVLEFDVEKKDRYGRTLAYIRKNGEMVNATMIADGFAYPLTIPPNVEYAKIFADLFRIARENRSGLWGDSD